MKVGNRIIEITHPDKIMFSDPTITKKEVIDYYHAIAKYMVPFLKDRVLTVQAFPEGVMHQGFYQKNVQSHYLSWIPTITIDKKDGGSTQYAIGINQAELVYLANQNCVVFHPWLSRVDKLDFPDKIVFDLDPSIDDFSAVQHAALVAKHVLEECGLVPFVMTTGSRGMHVVTPLRRLYTFEQVSDIARIIAERIVSYDPQTFTVEIRKDARKSKVFIDSLRNNSGATAVCPYSLRPRPGAPVATPITWAQATDKTLTSQQYNLYTVGHKLKKDGCAWKDFKRYAQTLVKACRALNTKMTDRIN
ncbi:hypothetical protein J120_05070 [candidate division TM6 bacterium JCVI TM6SC1]|uniref:DNA ligase D polymerase domain-containing protein n=1 Tax=candidate division TM6 bacterium JCVI TM6SC1 TaxID=1306947 RepID=A0A0D2JD43_9BACT|nr:hypothetical protein J120_05070 [candidate division TM6 bacterium JCVI TM6SC1]